MRKLTVISLLSAALVVPAASQEPSIGPSTGNRNAQGASFLRGEGVTVLRAISRAYGVPEHRIVGPSWIATEKYAINAEAPDRETFQTMLQKELANWFHLLVHREQRVIPVLVLKRSEGKTTQSATRPKGQLAFQMPQATMNLFADKLADIVHMPVFNETNLDGPFDIGLSYEVGNVGSLRNAIKQQLGLDVQDDKRAVDLLIVDHVEKAQVR
jgi:uncharacterized protein (TIGR03435 family)